MGEENICDVIISSHKGISNVRKLTLLTSCCLFLLLFSFVYISATDISSLWIHGTCCALSLANFPLFTNNDSVNHVNTS